LTKKKKEIPAPKSPDAPTVTHPVSGLVLGGPLDGTILAHNEETYTHQSEYVGVGYTIYKWDAIYTGPNSNEVVSFWIPKERSTHWMVAKLASFYRDQMEHIRQRSQIPKMNV